MTFTAADSTTGSDQTVAYRSTDLDELFATAARQAAAFRTSLPERRVAASDDLAASLARLQGALPAAPTDAAAVVEQLVAAGAAGVTGSAGPRFFGFVNGGALPAASAADMLVTGWDHPAFNAVLSPAGAAAEQVAGDWIKDIFGLPAHASVGFTTGAQAANTVGIAAARQHLLAEAGWDVGARGLGGAPAIHVIASQERHATIDASLRFLGIGTDAITEVACLANGETDMDDLARVLAADDPDALTIVVLQTGNVNTGACDDLTRGIALARASGAWVHVDGAFGLWAGASPRTAHLTAGVAGADSWCLDGHKWLQVPYDSGIAICAHPASHATAMAYSAAYLTGSESTAAGGVTYRLSELVAESSRRARGFAVWAALKELGRDGLADLIDRCCSHARYFAELLADEGAEIVNDVVINQVLFGFPGVDSDALAGAIQADGTCWLGGTTWRGRRLLRISVSNYTTTRADIERSAAAITRLAASLR